MQNNEAVSAQQMADLFESLSEAVDSFREQHLRSLDSQQTAGLEASIAKLDEAHDYFTYQAVQTTLAAIQGDINSIQTVTARAKDSLQHLQSVAKGMKIASSLAGLAAGILTGDYGLIPASIADIVTALGSDSATISATESA